MATKLTVFLNRNQYLLNLANRLSLESRHNNPEHKHSSFTCLFQLCSTADHSRRVVSFPGSLVTALHE